jgi:hypothetical protein
MRVLGVLCGYISIGTQNLSLDFLEIYCEEILLYSVCSIPSPSFFDGGSELHEGMLTLHFGKN